MAKTGLSQVTTAETFQTWLDRTNDIVTLLGTDVLTASTLGDSTTGNATLVGTFTANTVVAFNTLRADTFSPKVGSISISANAPINTTTSLQVAQTLTSTLGPRINLSSGSVIWTTGFENTTDNVFIIDAGTGGRKLQLTPAGNLTVAGSITAGTGGFVGNIDGDVTGNVTGNVSGQAGTVAALTGLDTDDLTEGATNKYFSNTLARGAFSASTGVTITSGAIAIGQAVGTTSNVTFNEMELTGQLSVVTEGSSSTISVTDTGSTNGANIKLSGNGVTTPNKYVRSFSGNFEIVDSAYTNIILRLSDAGGLSVKGDVTGFATASDIRKKENITKINNALEKVLSVSGYTYNFIGDDRRIAGVIAQEIEKILPEVVYEIDDEEFGKSKAVRYGNIVGLLIEAIKELAAEFDEMKANKE